MNVKVRRHLWRLAISSRSSIDLRFITKQAGFLKVQTHCPRPDKACFSIATPRE